MSAVVAGFRRKLSIALRRPAEWAQPLATTYGIVALFMARSLFAMFAAGGR